MAASPDYTAPCNSANNRVSCGWAGITQSQCRARGCCWDSSVAGVPWCSYYGQG